MCPNVVINLSPNPSGVQPSIAVSPRKSDGCEYTIQLVLGRVQTGTINMTDFQNFRSVVLATDFSARSAAAEQRAVAIASKFQAQLHVVSAIEPIIGLDDSDDDAAEFEEFYDRLLSRADREIEKRLADWADANVAVKHHVKIGPRWKVILECAESEDADLVVLGRSTLNLGNGLPLGTTSQKVFLASSRPVMFVTEEEG